MKLHPAYLWIGSESILLDQVSVFLKKVLCSSTDSCDKCYDCKAVNQNRHHMVRFLEPENTYTVAQLEVIFDTIIYSLGKSEHFFFIVKRADLLTATCANSLLKSLEEPPSGYHFILLSSRKEGLLPTISSRCVIQNFDSSDLKNYPLHNHFLDINNLNELEFQKDLSKIKMSERDIMFLVDQLYNYWYLKLKKAIVEDDSKAIFMCNQVIEVFNNVRSMPPMPGSSKIFLKNMFLQFMNIRITHP